MAKQTDVLVKLGTVEVLHYALLGNGHIALVLEQNNYTTQVGVNGYKLGLPKNLEVEDLGPDSGKALSDMITDGNGDS